MTANIVLLSVGSLKALDVEPEAFAGSLAEWREVDRSILVDGWGDLPEDPDFAGSNLFLVGRREPLSGYTLQTQFPIDVSEARWMAGDSDVVLKTRIKAELKNAARGIRPLSKPFDPVRKVAVYGETAAASAMVDALIARNIDVVWAVPEGVLDGYDKESAEVVPCVGIDSITGFAGGFNLVLDAMDGRKDVSCGAVVIASPEKRKTDDVVKAFPFIKLSEFDQEEVKSKAGSGERFNLVFTAGIETHASTSNMRKILDNAITAASIPGVSVYVLTPHVKVAEEGLEKRYGGAREAGVIFLRVPDGEELTTTSKDGRVGFRIFDIPSRADVFLRPDLIVAEESMVASERLSDWSEKLGITLGADGFLGPDNVLFSPSATNRRGIFTIGPARGTDSGDILGGEIAATVDSIEELFGTTEFDSMVVVDELKCAHCLTCLRVCPHNAILFSNKPMFNPAACAACGICAAKCPARAITLIGASENQGMERINVLISQNGVFNRVKTNGEPRLLMFGCRRSAQTAMRESVPDFPVDLTFHPLACGGAMDEKLILNSFNNGVDGVIVAVCHEGNCRTDEGSPDAALRVRRLKELMADVGGQPERLEFMTLAPNMGVDFRRKVKNFRERIINLAPATV